MKSKKSKSLVFMSDIHIGSGQPTNWYQSDVHDPYIEAALAWIANPSPITTDGNTLDTAIQEFVILGDLFDQWTYVPTESVDNMSFAAIVKNNPNIFSKDSDSGALINTVQTLGRKGIPTIYLNGNHDMDVTIDDIKSLTTNLDYYIQQVDDSGKVNPAVTQANLGQFYLPSLGTRDIYCTHGHIYSLLCAPDYKNAPKNYNSKPYSYFLTRTMALIITQIMADQKVANSAQLPGSGSPFGFFGKKEMAAILGIAWLMFEYCKKTGKKDGISHELNIALEAALVEKLVPADQWSPYTIPGVTSNNPTMTDIAKTYQDLALYDNKTLSTTYPSVPGIASKYYGDIDQEPVDNKLTEAFVGTDATSNIIGFASDIDKTLNGPIQVMGHTHIPMDTETGLNGALNGMYVNSGFMCPSQPDMADGKKAPSFAVIEWDDTTSTYTSWVVEMKMVSGTVTLNLNSKLMQKLT